MNKNQTRLIAFLTITAFVLAFLISNRIWFRLDMTWNNAHTLSEVSRNLHREITDQVVITYFVSDRLRRSHPMPGIISDLLREYAAHSRGKIRVIERDPARANLSQRVEELGIIPHQIHVVERNESTVAMVYSGILIEYLDRQSVIPVVFSVETLEFDLSSRIRSLVRNTERNIGIIAADAHKDWSFEYRLLIQELFLAGFNVRLLRPGEEIPNTLPALFVLGGAEYLDEYQLSHIDRFILNGGNVLFAVDGIFVNRDTLVSRAVMDMGLLAMLANYGVVVRPALVHDRPALNLTYQLQSGAGTVIRTIRYPQWIGVLEQAGNPNHHITARFHGLDLYWASPLELSPPPGINAEILFTSTADAWLQTRNFTSAPAMLPYFQNELEETLGTKILGASLSGMFPGAARPSRIIVVGDSDFAGALMQVNRGEARNLGFLLKAAEWLSNDDDLIAIRGRDAGTGRLDRITDREQRDRVMAFSRVLNTFIIPLLVIVTGLILILGWRRKR